MQKPLVMSWPPTELRRPGGGWCLDDVDLTRVEAEGPALQAWVECLLAQDAEALQLTALEVPVVIRQDLREPIGDTPLSAELILKTVLQAVPVAERENLMTRGMLDLALPSCRMRARVGPRGIQVRLDRLEQTVTEPSPPPPQRGPVPLSFEGLSLADLPVVSESSGLFIPEAEIAEHHLTAPPPVAPLRLEPALAPRMPTNGPPALRPRGAPEEFPLQAPPPYAAPVTVTNRPPVLGGARAKAAVPPPPPVRAPELVRSDGSLAIEDAEVARLPDPGFTLAELLSVARRRGASRLELEGGAQPTAAVDGRQVAVGLPVLSPLEVYRLLLEALTLEARRMVLESGVLDGLLPHADGPWRIFVRLDRVGLMVILEFGY